MIVAVVGKGRNCRPEVVDLARHVGRQVAVAGHVLVCGGLGGVMMASAEGASEAGGVVLGVVPNEDAANGHCTIVVRTGLPPTVRNVVIGSCCDAMLALDGSHGTMQEIAVALDRGVPIAAVETQRWASLVQAILSPDDVRGWLDRTLDDVTRGSSLSAPASEADVLVPADASGA